MVRRTYCGQGRGKHGPALEGLQAWWYKLFGTRVELQVVEAIGQRGGLALKLDKGHVAGRVDHWQHRHACIAAQHIVDSSHGVCCVRWCVKQKSTSSRSVVRCTTKHYGMQGLLTCRRRNAIRYNHSRRYGLRHSYVHVAWETSG